MECLSHNSEIVKIFSNVRIFSFQEKKAPLLDEDGVNSFLDAINDFKNDLNEKTDKIYDINERIEKITWFNNLNEEDLMLLNDLISSAKDLKTSLIRQYTSMSLFRKKGIAKNEIKDFKIGYRLRYQNKNELGISYDEEDYANQNIRFKTSLEYNIKNWKLDPKFSAEIFNKFQEGEENGFNKYRLTLGTDYKTKNFGKIGVFYRYQKELNVDFPDSSNIIGLKYIYTIKNK